MRNWEFFFIIVTIFCHQLEKLNNFATRKTNYMKIKTIIISAITILFAACNNDNKQAQSSIDENFIQETDTVAKEINKETEEFYQKATEENDADNLARFLAGKPVEKFATLQNTEHYKNYAKKCKQQWEDLTKKTLNPIQNWCKQNIKDFYEDSTCLFYPFGGPDIVFAMTFFPYEEDYVLFGLENPGFITDPTKISDTKIQAYLDSLNYSFRYLNRFGFFIAGQMRDDFKNEHLDGTLHIVLYTLAMEECKITNYRNIYLDDRGNIKESDGNPVKHPYGWEIVFKKDGEDRIRTVKYFRMDMSDPPMTGKMEFPFFLNSVKEKTCYLKSASYLLQGVEFKIMQKLVVNQFDKILQDESGLAYGNLKKDYDIRLFGTYSRPLKVFSIFKQEDLKNALAANNCKALPFKIGYASQLNESVLMACTRKDPNAPKQEVKNEIENKTIAYTEEIVYKVQFKVSWKKLNDNELKGIKDVDYYTDNSAYKYTAGNFKSEKECQDLLKEMQNKGYKDAFIVRFCNGKRIK